MLPDFWFQIWRENGYVTKKQDWGHGRKPQEARKYSRTMDDDDWQRNTDDDDVWEATDVDDDRRRMMMTPMDVRVQKNKPNCRMTFLQKPDQNLPWTKKSKIVTTPTIKARLCIGIHEAQLLLVKWRRSYLRSCTSNNPSQIRNIKVYYHAASMTALGEKCDKSPNSAIPITWSASYSESHHIKNWLKARVKIKYGSLHTGAAATILVDNGGGGGGRCKLIYVSNMACCGCCWGWWYRLLTVNGSSNTPTSMTSRSQHMWCMHANSHNCANLNQ